MIAFVTNRVTELGPEQTTTRLIEAGLEGGRRVALLDVYSLSVRSASEIRAEAVVLDGVLDRGEICAAAAGPRTSVDLGTAELIVIRTSPGRDLDNAWAHRLALQALRLARDLGVAVVNDPVGLGRASSKLYSACLPADLTPRTLVTHRATAAREFIASLDGPAVLKPLIGSGGRDVFLVDGPDAPNLDSLCAVLGRTGYIVVQEFVDAPDHEDIRVLLLDGEILEVGGVLATVKRVPRAGEFRSNVSLGARAEPVELEAGQRANARRAAALLAEDGIRFAGLDLIGDRIVEANVYSTGGVVDAELFYGQPFARVILEALLG